MAALRARPFQRADLDSVLELVASNARSRWPAPSYLLNSDVAWRLADGEENLKLWFDERGLAAYAWFELITPCVFDLRGDLSFEHPIAGQLLDWLEAQRLKYPPREPWLLELESMAAWEAALDAGAHLAEGRRRVLQVSAFDGAQERIRCLEADGYSPSGHFDYHLRRDLADPGPAPDLPPGWRVRAVSAGELDARVAVHRDSWFASTYTREQYLAVRALPSYDRSLDLVAEAPSGELASYCIAWVDAASGIGSFEPVGTPPAWRQRGLGRAVQLEGLRRLRAKGMRRARISTAGFNEPAYGLYRSCGFELADRARTYIKVL